MSNDSDHTAAFIKYYSEIVTKLRSNYDFPFQKGDFIKYTWRTFDIEYNLSALLTSKEPYFAHRQVVFAAFCAWLVAPANNQLRRDAVVGAMVKTLSHFEDDIIEKNHDHHLITEITNRISQIGRDFFEEIYYPIGGLVAISNHSSSAEIRKALRQEAVNVERITFIFQVLHYAATEFQNGTLRRSASKNMVIEAVDRLAEKKKIGRGLRERTAGPLWSEYEQSALLLYAAHHVKVRSRPRLRDKSFIEAVLTNEISFDHDVNSVSEIISRASYLKKFLAKGVSQEMMPMLNQFQMPAVSHIETSRDNVRYKNIEIPENNLRYYVLGNSGDQ